MTATEKMELCDSLDAVSLALTKAKYLYDEIKSAYFDKYDPTMSGNGIAREEVAAFIEVHTIPVIRQEGVQVLAHQTFTLV